MDGAGNIGLRDALYISHCMWSLLARMTPLRLPSQLEVLSSGARRTFKHDTFLEAGVPLGPCLGRCLGTGEDSHVAYMQVVDIVMPRY